jgi:hypothetical protein
MAKVLIVEPPNEKEREYPWNEATKRRWELTSDDAELLEADGSIFKDDVAFTLEDEDERQLA